MEGLVQELLQQQQAQQQQKQGIAENACEGDAGSLSHVAAKAGSFDFEDTLSISSAGSRPARPAKKGKRTGKKRKARNNEDV
eukprot:scaffold181493_cov22-Tisochrysis_lutea.AAC.2